MAKGSQTGASEKKKPRGRPPAPGEVRNPTGVNQFSAPRDDPEWLTLYDMEWCQEFPNDTPDGPRKGTRTMFKRLLKSKPLEFVAMYTTLLRRLKPGNLWDERAREAEAKERASDTHEAVIADTIKRIMSELATVATGE